MGLSYTPKKRKFYDSLRNYIMTMVPREHEMSLLQFVDKAIMEAYQNGQHMKGNQYETKSNHSKKWN